MKRPILSILPLVIVLQGCVHDETVRHCAAQPRPSLDGEPAPVVGARLPRASRVVLIGVDGLGARWIPWDAMPNLSRLRDEGAFAVARCHRPTASAINWKSVFSGLPPEIHGYNKWNSQKPDIEPAPSAFGSDGALPDLFAEVRRQRPDAWTASFYTWGGVGHCHATNVASVARHFGGPGSIYPERDSSVIDEGLRQLSTSQPLLMFLYQGQVDSSGHANGWGSPEYTNACRNVDANIGRFLDGLREAGLWDETAVVFVADHGGLDKGHGGVEDIRAFEVPFIVSGGAAKGLRLREPAMLMDVAPTILDLLGLDIPATMRGRPAAFPAKTAKIDWIVSEALEHDDVHHTVYCILVATAIDPGGLVHHDAYELITRAVQSLSFKLQSGEHEEGLTGYALELQYVNNRLRSGWGQYVNPVILEDFQIQYEAFLERHSHLTLQVVTRHEHSSVLSLDLALKTSNPFRSILLARACIEKQSMEENSSNIVQHWRDEFFLPVQKFWDKHTARYVQRDCIMDDFSFNCMAFFIYYSFYDLVNSIGFAESQPMA